MKEERGKPKARKGILFPFADGCDGHDDGDDGDDGRFSFLFFSFLSFPFPFLLLLLLATRLNSTPRLHLTTESHSPLTPFLTPPPPFPPPPLPPSTTLR